jgi:tetratricopeptide (TPR) repeat protein
VTAARQTVLDHPRAAAAWGELGKVFFAHAFEAEADASFREAVTLDPDDGRWPYYRGLFAAGRDPEAAVAHFRKAAAGRHPNAGFAATARLRLAEALLDRQEFEEAARLFDGEVGSETEATRVRAAYGLGLVALARDDAGTAAGHLAAVADSPFARTRGSAHLARLARLRGDAEAAARFEAAATRPPPDRAWPDPFVAEANRLRAGQQEALQQADALARRGRPAEAAELLTALSRDYPNELTFQATGAVLIQLGDYSQAEQVLQGCLALDPSHPQAHHLLAMAYFLHGELVRGRGETDRAAELFRRAADHGGRAAERKPDFASAYVFRGRALRYLGRPDDAVAALRKAVECRPEVADGHLYLGEALAEAGRRDEARASLHSAEKLAGPNDPRPRAALAKLEGQK